MLTSEASNGQCHEYHGHRRRHSLELDGFEQEPIPACLIHDDFWLSETSSGETVPVRETFAIHQGPSHDAFRSDNLYFQNDRSPGSTTRSKRTASELETTLSSYKRHKLPPTMAERTSGLDYLATASFQSAPQLSESGLVSPCGEMRDSGNESIRSEVSSAQSKSPNKDTTKIHLWNLRVAELRHFRQVYGHCVVPHNYEESQPLAQWTKRQRYQHKLKHAGKHSTLTEARERELDDLGFVWDSHAAKWEEKYNELIAFKADHGHCLVPITSKSHRQLAIWVKCQRRMYLLRQQGEQTGMTDLRISRLESVGFVWLPRLQRV